MEGEAFWVASLLFKSVLTHWSQHVAGLSNLPGCVCMHVCVGVFVMTVHLCAFTYPHLTCLFTWEIQRMRLSLNLFACVWVCVTFMLWSQDQWFSASTDEEGQALLEKTASLFVSNARPAHRGWWIDRPLSQAFSSDKGYWARPADCHMTHHRL